MNPTTLRRFYLRHKVKYFNVSYTYNQSFKDKVKRDEEIRAFSMKLAEAVAKEELVVYFDSASFNMWIPSNKSWTYYDNPVKLVLNKLRGRGITVMGGAHMVALVYLDDKWAALLDNNAVEKYVWVPRETLIAEWKASYGWAVTPIYTPAAPLPQ